MSKYAVAIQTEIDGNVPLYGAMTDAQVAAEMNAIDKDRNRTSMSRQEIYSQIESSALSALTDNQLAQLNLALSDTVDPHNANIEQVFTTIFAGGSVTLLALAAARQENVSRATILNLPFIHAGWVANARSLV